ncbi:MAG: GspH/FimT family pseudopilin [Lysobacteraceae bacterium]
MRTLSRLGPRPAAIRGRHARTAGFTLIELMIAVFVMAVVIAISVPLFTNVVNASRLTSNANELVAAMQSARAEAIRQNRRTSLCGSDDGLNCSNTTPWRGWIVFTDANGNGLVDAGERVRSGNIEAPLQVLPSANITGANNRILFRADGLAYGNGGMLLEANLRVCLPTSTPPENVRDVNLAMGGRATVRAAVNAAGACAAPGNT